MIDAPKNILYCVLNWGIGHAARSTAIIEEQLALGHQVAIASDGISGKFLKKIFPTLTYHQLPEWNITYLKNSATLGVLLKLPIIIKWLIQDHKAVNEIVDRFGYTTIISDNRFTCYSQKIESIYVTHQLGVASRGGMGINKLATKIHRWFMSHYDTIWVPDYADPDDRLAGILSAPYDHEIRYIGPKSRLMYTKAIAPEEFPKTLVILSGPKSAQESLLELVLLTNKSDSKLTIVSPSPINIPERKSSICDVIIDPSAPILKGLILSAKMIICRSGYSSIMDLALLKRHANYIPTKGQPEQEYLALIHNNYHKSNT